MWTISLCEEPAFFSVRDRDIAWRQDLATGGGDQDRSHESSVEWEIPQGRVFPWNLKTAHLRAIAESFSLPCRGPVVADVKLAIEGQFREEHEVPQNVQVAIKEEADRLELYLMDEG